MSPMPTTLADVDRHFDKNCDFHGLDRHDLSENAHQVINDLHEQLAAAFANIEDDPDALYVASALVSAYATVADKVAGRLVG